MSSSLRVARRGAALVSLASVALVFIAGAGCGDGTPTTAPTPDAARVALAARLTERHLSFRWVACVDEGARHGGEIVFRCNVNFGAPHIPGYCVVVRGGRAVTHLEEPSLRCRRERGRE
ncbi:MAG TPA: hypothetical protein VJB36_08940 [Methylomirabilota bacterium]|nr:hypothetical protein [Methylomirabilota bacterium]